MSGGCYEQICKPTPVRPANLDDSRDNLPIATGGRSIEGQGLECRLDLLQSDLATSFFGPRRCQMRTSSQFGEGDR